MAVFLDTNILLYSISNSPNERAKRDIAHGLLDRNDCVLSVQVLQEFYVQATRSTRSGALPHDLAVRFVESWMRFPVQENTSPLLLVAFDIRQRFKLSFWDSMVVAAAKTGGCDTLFSEDMGDGQIVDGVRIVNPF